MRKLITCRIKAGVSMLAVVALLLVAPAKADADYTFWKDVDKGGTSRGFGGWTDCHCWYNFNDGTYLNDMASSSENYGYSTARLHWDWYQLGPYQQQSYGAYFSWLNWINDQNSSHHWV